jgi:Flp pilus assembly protein TadG
MIGAIARQLQPLRRDRRGAMAAQFSLTLPLWIIMIFAVFNISRFYWARAGLQNGLGEAARTATLWPVRNDTVLREAFEDMLFGMTSAEVPTLNVTRGTANGQNFVDIRVTYNPQFYLLFVPVQPITLTYSRRAFPPPG